MGGQPFWAIDEDGNQTHIVGYEILFRHAAVRPDKMHNAPVKTFFTGRENGNGVALFDTIGGPPESTIMRPDSPRVGVSELQSDLVEAKDCRLVIVQIEWAKRILLTMNGQIKFITINIRPDEFIMECQDGVKLKKIMLEAAQAVKEVGSEIIYELTEYAAFVPEELYPVLYELRGSGVSVWADDVSVFDYMDKKLRKGQYPQGLKPDTHATIMPAVKGLFTSGLISGHKLASEVCIQLTDKPLQRFPATNRGRKAFSTSPDLDVQYGPVGAKQNIAGPQVDRPSDFEYLRQETSNYLKEVNAINADAIFVIENSSEAKEIKKFQERTEFQILGKNGHHPMTLIQGGISADLALDMYDMMNLHTVEAVEAVEA